MKPPHTTELRVGSRSSDLAMTQTRIIMAALQTHWPNLHMTICPISTLGDAIPNQPIAALGKQGGEGVFNKALEQALLNDEVDVVTASLKDVESDLAAGVMSLCVGQRQDPRDVLVSKHGAILKSLRTNARLGCSSPRRIGQLKALRTDVAFMPMRGNVPTRIAQGLQRYDGVVLAAAGLLRLGLQQKISQYFTLEEVLPAPAQGALAVEFLAKRKDVAALLKPLEHPPTQHCVNAERTLLRTLSGGCFAPVGALATLDATTGNLRLSARVVSLDGKEKIEGSTLGALADGQRVAERLGKQLLAQGAGSLVKTLRQHLSKQV